MNIMRKTLFSIALGLAAVTAVTANAQTETKDVKCTQECSLQKCDAKKDVCKNPANCSKTNCSKANCTKADCAKADCAKADCKAAKNACNAPAKCDRNRHHGRMDGNHAREKRIGGRVDPFAGIQLDETQKQKLQDLNRSRQAEIQKAREEERKKLGDINAKYDEQLKSVLTPEQFAAYQENMNKTKDSFNGRKGCLENSPKIKPAKKDGGK